MDPSENTIAQDTLSSIDDLSSECDDVPPLPEDVEMPSCSTTSTEEPVLPLVPKIIVTPATEESDMEISDSSSKKVDNLIPESGRKETQRRKSFEMSESPNLQVVYIRENIDKYPSSTTAEPPIKKLVKFRPASELPDSSTSTSDDNKKDAEGSTRKKKYTKVKTDTDKKCSVPEEGKEKIQTSNLVQAQTVQEKCKNEPLEAQPSTSRAGLEKQPSLEKDDSSSSYESMSTTQSSKSATKSTTSISNEDTKTYDSEILDDILEEQDTEELSLDDIVTFEITDEVEDDKIVQNCHDHSDNNLE